MFKRLLLASFCLFAAGAALAQTVAIEPTVFVGTGLNDARSGGFYTPAPANAGYVAVISATGSPDHFTWAKNGGSASSPVAITGGSCLLPATPGTNGWLAIADGANICWLASTGHHIGDLWEITAQATGSAGTFVQTGVGAVVARSLQAAKRDAPSLMDFIGADPTGATSSTAAMKSALASFPPGGGMLWVPVGIFKLGNFTVPTGVTIQCAGKNSTILNFSGTGTFIAPATAAYNQQLSIRDCGMTNSGGSPSAIAVSLTGVWFSEIKDNRATGWGTGLSMDGTNYGVYSDTIALNEFPGTGQAILCTGGGGQACNQNHFDYNRATGFGAVALACAASVCEYNRFIGQDFEDPLGSVSTIWYQILGDNNTLESSDCDSGGAVPSTLTYTCMQIRGGGNTTQNNKDSLDPSGPGIAVFLDRLWTPGACNTFNEISNGAIPIYEFGDCVGGAAVVVKSVSSGPSLRLANLNNAASMCNQWGFNAYSDGGLYIQNMTCALPIPGTNFNAARWTSSGLLYQSYSINLGGAGGDARYFAYSSDGSIWGQFYCYVALGCYVGSGTGAPLFLQYNGSTIGTILATGISVTGLTTSSLGFESGTSAGVTCSGTPTSSFASVGGIVTHC